MIRTAAGSIFPTISLAVQSLDSVLLLGADLEAGEYAAFFAIVCERKSLQRNLHALADERLDRVMHVVVDVIGSDNAVRRRDLFAVFDTKKLQADTKL